MHTYEIIGVAIDQRQGGPGVRPVARVLGITEASTYRQGREPMSDEDPDATGAFNFLDRFEAFVRMLATYPRARWILLRLESWVRALFDQVLHRDEPDPCDDTIRAALGRAAKEHGEAALEILAGENGDEAALEEVAEARDAYERLEHLLISRVNRCRNTTPAMRRVS